MSIDFGVLNSLIHLPQLGCEEVLDLFLAEVKRLAPSGSLGAFRLRLITKGGTSFEGFPFGKTLTNSANGSSGTQYAFVCPESGKPMIAVFVPLAEIETVSVLDCARSINVLGSSFTGYEDSVISNGFGSCRR